MKNKSIQPVSAGGTNFLISIYHQENLSYQGVVQWLETGEKVHFRSELELMNLIHSATLEQQGEQALRDWNLNSQSNVS